jgi:hypothetical protein
MKKNTRRFFIAFLLIIEVISLLTFVYGIDEEQEMKALAGSLICLIVSWPLFKILNTEIE